MITALQPFSAAFWFLFPQPLPVIAPVAQEWLEEFLTDDKIGEWALADPRIPFIALAVSLACNTQSSPVLNLSNML